MPTMSMMLSGASAGGAGTTFPTLTNLILKIDSDLGVTVDGSSRVTNATDNSGTGNDLVSAFTPSTANVLLVLNELNTYPVFRTTGTGTNNGALYKGSGATVPGTNNWSMGLIVKPATTASNVAAFSFGSNSTGYSVEPYGNATNLAMLLVSVDRLTTGTAGSMAWQRVLFVRAAGTLTAYKDGSTLSPTNASTPNAPADRIDLFRRGESGSGSTFGGIPMDFVHAFACNAALNSTEIADWFTYGATKYAL